MNKILLLMILLFLIPIVSAEERVTNGGFETGNSNGWFVEGSLTAVGAWKPHNGTYSLVTQDMTTEPDFYSAITQTVDVTNVDDINLWMMMDGFGGTAQLYLDDEYQYDFVFDNSDIWYNYDVDVSGYTGNTIFKIHVLYDGVIWIDDISALTVTPPLITSYSNSITNDESTTVNGEIGVDITFNITTDQPITTYNWYKDDVNQNNNNDELTTSFSSGNHTLTTSGTNDNGTSNTITWNIINPNTITLEAHSSLPSTFINDADSTGGFVNNNGYITLTPIIASSYPLSIENNLYEGIKLTFVSTSIINSIPLTLTGLNPSQDYALYESGTLQYEFRSTSPSYFYDITTHDEISSFQLIKLSAGGGSGGNNDDGNSDDDNNDDENNNDDNEDIIDDIEDIIDDIEDIIDDIFDDTEDIINSTAMIIFESKFPIELTELTLKEPIKTVTTLIKNPTNWLIFLGAYLGILISMLILPLKVNYADILLYGTLTWILSLLLLTIGLNLSLNYIFTSISSILGFLTYVIYGIIMSIYLLIKGE